MYFSQMIFVWPKTCFQALSVIALLHNAEYKNKFDTYHFSSQDRVPQNLLPNHGVFHTRREGGCIPCVPISFYNYNHIMLENAKK